MTIALIYDAASDPVENVGATARAIAKILDAVLIPFELPVHDSVERLMRASPDAVFNLCEGLENRPEHESHVAALLEILGYAYTGSCPAALGLCLDKVRTKQVLRAAGLRVPGGRRFPMIVKPIRDDASHGISRASVIHRRRPIPHGYFAEEFVDGREFNVAVLGERPLPISEIEFTVEPRIVTHAAKWSPGSPDDVGTKPVCPARVSPTLRGRLQRAALAAFRATGCRDYARVDVRFDRRVHILEVNPNPDLSPDAGFARAAAAAGYSYRSLVETIAGFALERRWKSGSASSRKAPAASRS